MLELNDRPLYSLTVAEFSDLCKDLFPNQLKEAKEPPQSPKYVDINGAARITSKSTNALRVQISLGNLKSFKRGSRHYFDREYLEKWLTGDSGTGGLHP
jgi:hypothetical protein